VTPEHTALACCRMTKYLLAILKHSMSSGDVLPSRTIKYATTVALAAMATSSLSAQILMRRPIENLPTSTRPDTGPVNPTPTPTPGTTPAPTPTPTPAPGTTPTPTPTPGTTPDPEPPVVDDPATDLVDPVVRMCDNGAASPDAVLRDVAWVEDGWDTAGAGEASCNTQKMRYSCQATYTCTMDGRVQTFTSTAPDATCENYAGEVGYPAGTGPASAPNL